MALEWERLIWWHDETIRSLWLLKEKQEKKINNKRNDY